MNLDDEHIVELNVTKVRPFNVVLTYKYLLCATEDELISYSPGTQLINTFNAEGIRDIYTYKTYLIIIYKNSINLSRYE